MKTQRPRSNQPIPEIAKKVFQGKVFAVYQWPQIQFDGSTSTFEKVKRNDTVSVLPITADNKIVLTQQEQPGTKPFIDSIGGEIDRHETPLQAAKRELLEESGYEAKEFKLWYAIQPVGKVDWAIYFFIAKQLKKVGPANLDAGEKIKLIYISFAEFLKIVVKDNFRDTETTLKILLAKEEGQLSTIQSLFTR